MSRIDHDIQTPQYPLHPSAPDFLHKNCAVNVQVGQHSHEEKATGSRVTEKQTNYECWNVAMHVVSLHGGVNKILYQQILVIICFVRRTILVV